MTQNLRLAATAAVAALGSVIAPAVAQELADDRASYSYVRTLDGRATLASSQRAPGEEVGLHEPLERGDLLRVEPGARLEVVLADRNLLRLGGGATLRLAQVAFSADGDDRVSRFDLEEGEILLDVTDEALGDELPEIRTPAGTVFIHQPGRYRLLLTATGELQLTVREGYAELLTDRGSTVVRSGEEAWTSSDRWQSVQVATAGPLGALERWADDLEQRSRRASHRELRVEPYLAYSAASLDDYGSWVYLDSSWYWRPRVEIGWRPYWDGRWAYTRRGLTWVSYEPWGWVPYHYGSWRIVPGYGWVWQPGRVYSPAWVYWHVGPSWTGWCPVGYYTHHYRGYWNDGFRFGVYGWAGGSWGFYADWSFLPTQRLFYRDGRSWRRTGNHLARTEGPNVPRGIVTTDTSGLPRDDWKRPADLVRDLERRAPARGAPGERLIEVTDFIARRPTLPPSVAQTVRRGDDDHGAARRANPLDPGAPLVASRSGRPDVPGWKSQRTPERRTDLGTTRDDAGRSGDLADGSSRLRGGFGREPDVPREGSPNANGWHATDTSARRSDAGDRRPLGTPTFDAGNRQGWRRDAPSTTGGVASPPAYGRPSDERGRPSAGDPSQGRGGSVSTMPSTGSEPVTRVIGGVRRSTQGAEPGRPGTTGGSSHAPSASPGSGSSPRATTGTTPPAGWRSSPRDAGASTPSARPTPSSPPTTRSTPPTARSATPPPRTGSPSVGARSAPPSRGGASASSASGGQNRGGSSASSSSKRSTSRGGSSDNSQSSSSPPPKRGRSSGGR